MVYRAPKSTAPLFVPPRSTQLRCWQCGDIADPKIGTIGGHIIHLCNECSAISLLDHTMPDGVRKPSPRELDTIIEATEKRA